MGLALLADADDHEYRCQGCGATTDEPCAVDCPLNDEPSTP